MIAILGWLGYTTYANIEHKRFESQFESSAKLLLDSIARNFAKVEGSGNSVATLYMYRYPNESQWPFITMDGFQQISLYRLNISNCVSSSFFPIINTTTNRRAWESYANATSISAVGKEALGVGSWPASDGIFDVSDNGTRFYAPDIAVGSIYPDLITPFWQSGMNA